MTLRLPLRALFVAATFLVAFGLWVGMLRARAWLDDPRAFDGVSWELAAFPGKWLHAIRTDEPDSVAVDEVLREYFALPNREGAAARALERPVEAAIEGRLDATLAELGVPVLLGRTVWPPVAIELTEPPRMLAVSPRSRIRLVRTLPLAAGQVTDAAGLEEEIESVSSDQAAIVVPLGGISTYPAIVTAGSTYAGTVQVAAHEWVHHAFAFAPLGWRSLTSRESLAINETAADIVGAEVATRVLERFGDPTAAPRDTLEGRPPGAPLAAVEAQRVRGLRDAALRELRREVDALLESGQVEAAEARMEAARLELMAAGVPIRRLNQAFFAWYGTYAARGDSIDPLGVQLRQLRAAAGSLPAFLDVVGRTTTRADVERALRDRGVAPADPPR